MSSWRIAGILGRISLGLIIGITIAAMVARAQAPAGSPAGSVLLPAQIDQWTTVVGVLLPLAIAVINRERWASGEKALAAIGICVLAAAGDVFFKGQFSLKNWSQTALYIFFLVVTSYAGFWRPTGIADKVGKATG